MFVSVAIQTYNRSGMLAQTLESLRQLRPPVAADYEVLVVDNNSKDDTPEVIRRYADELAPRLRSVFEPRQGLSHARNRALAEAKGDIVAFTDDDVCVDPGWLQALCDAFAKYSASVVGGRSYLIYPTPEGRPSWLPAERETLYSRLDHGPEVCVGIDKDLFGLNFSVLKRAAIEAGGFDVTFGRRGTNLACGEEEDLLNRIRQAGGIVVYEPGAVVGHRVLPERLTKRWLLRRVYQGAASGERLRRVQGLPAERIGPLFVRVLRCWGSVAKAKLIERIPPTVLTERQIVAATRLGQLVTTIRLAWRTKSKNAVQ